MKRKPLLRFCKGDWSAIVLVLLLAAATAAAFLPERGSGGHAVVQILMDGAVIQEMPLEADAQYTLQGAYTNIVEIRDGEVSIIESDCPGADCVHSGRISSAGRSIVCLPNKAEVRVIGTEGEVDFVVR